MASRAATAVKTKPKSKSKSTATKAKASTSTADTVATAEATVAKPKTRRKAKAETRTRIYWAVFNQSLKRVAVFEFDQKAEAEKRAAALMKSSGEHHFIQKIKAAVPAS